MKAGFLTFGCKVNQYETQVMRETLLSAGYEIAENGDIPDIFVINSCTVTAESDRKTRQALRKYRGIYPGAILVLTGCMPQAAPQVGGSGGAFAEVDIILGNKNYHRLPEAISRHRETGAQIVMISGHEKGEKFSGAPVSEFHERTRAYLKIQDGCDNFCAYCVIPSARGRVRSKPLTEIREELAVLSEKYREIVLVGINLTSYGAESGSGICEAVEAAAEFGGIKRIRLGSMEPDKLTPEVLARLAKIPKLCPHFHLSLQSGCDATLRRMNRRYTAARYAEICRQIRELWPGAAITTDIMVGFPGETEAEFAESLAFAETVGFAQAHIFAYSRRPGTKAADMDGQISNNEKKRRSQLLTAATEASAMEFLNGMKGNIYPVLFESEGGGHTPGYTYVNVENTGIPGEIADVIITEIQNGEAFARAIDN